MRADVALLEREEVVARVTRLLDRVEDGGSGALFVVGEAGLGKTSVVDKVRAMAAGRMRVGHGRGHPMDTALGFGLAVQAFDELGGHEVLFPAAVASLGQPRSTPLYAVLEWLAGQAPRPALLVLDDMHWADPDSLVLVSFLCRRLASLGMGIVAMMRPWPSAAHDMAAELAHDGYGELSWLAPLSRPAAAVLLGDRCERIVSGDAVGRAWRISGGNPLLLEQVAAVISRGEELPDAGAGRPTMPSIAVVLARFAGLSAAGLRCARAASVLGDSFISGLAAEIAQLPGEQVDGALEAMDRSGLVRAAPDGSTEFVHPLFAQALYSDLGAPLRARLHARAFTALVGRGREAEAAEHAVRAELLGDPVAVGVLQRVGLAARRAGAVTSAADRLHAAIELAGDGAQPDLLLTAGQALLEAGRPEPAVAAHERLLAHSDCPDAVRVEALHARGRALTYLGHYDRAEASLCEAGELAERIDPAAAVEVLLDHAMTFWTRTGPGPALPLITRARKIATQCAGASGWAHAASVNIALQCGHPPEAGEIERAIDGLDAWLAGGGTDPGGVFGALYNVATAACMLERFGDAERLFGAGVAVAAQRGGHVTVASFRPMHARTLFYMGRTDEALQVIERALDDADVFPMFEFYTCVGAACIAHYQGRGEQSVAWAARVEMLVHCPGDGPHPARLPGQDLVLLYVQEIRAQRALRDGLVQKASEAYLQIEATVHRIGIGEPCLVYWARHAVLAHLAAGAVADAERVIDWLVQRSAGLPCRWPRIALATSRAALAEAQGHPGLAETHFTEALHHHEHVQLPIEQIETMLLHGSFVRRSGQPARARPILVSALEQVEATGARWYGPPLRDELKLAGGRRRRSSQSPDQLTAAESRVARVVATGRSNKQVAAVLSLSVHTIEGHLDRIYGKLGIHSRGELIARAGTGPAVGGDDLRNGEDPPR